MMRQVSVNLVLHIKVIFSVKLDNQYYTEAEASLARGRISGAENIVKNDAAHFCVTQGKKMQIVDLKTEGAGLHGVARLTFKCGE